MLSGNKKGRNKYMLSSIVIPGIEPSPEYKELMEKEISGELTVQEIGEILQRPYKVKE